MPNTYDALFPPCRFPSSLVRHMARAADNPPINILRNIDPLIYRTSHTRQNHPTRSARKNASPCRKSWCVRCGDGCMRACLLLLLLLHACHAVSVWPRIPHPHPNSPHGRTPAHPHHAYTPTTVARDPQPMKMFPCDLAHTTPHSHTLTIHVPLLSSGILNPCGFTHGLPAILESQGACLYAGGCG